MDKFQVYCRYYSRLLQRALTDFEADVSFGQAAEKMREHYGLKIPACVIQKITEEHARKMADLKRPKTIASAKLLIAEMDG